MNAPQPRAVAIPQLLHVGRGCLGRLAPLFAEHDLDLGRVLVGSGPGPSRAFARAVADGLRAHGVDVVERGGLTGRLDQAAALAGTLIEEGATTAVAVGGGRVIDTVKLAAARTCVGFVSVPTAISNDGISSPVASLVGRDGARASHAASMPCGIVVDVDAIATAPAPTIRAGAGDLLSNLTACLDWRMAEAAGHEHHDAYATLIAESAARPLLEIEDLAAPAGQQVLAEGLLLSGLAMAAAGTSRPCSGAEHLISHALDARLGDRAALHGEQVALGSLVAAAAHDSPLLRTLRRTFARLGLPLSPEDAGIARDDLVAAVAAAQSLRPDRYTVLDERVDGLDAARRLVDAACGAAPAPVEAPAAPRFARPLREATLASHARHVAVPEYDRAALVPGVVHISVGSFHRAHQAVYFDDLARLGHRDWGVLGVSLRRPHVQEALTAQDGLYTVVTRGDGHEEARVIGSMRRCLFAPRDREAVLRALAQPRTRLVTLTITAEGYAEDGPASAMGCLAEALARRRRAGLPPFTVLSCDNVPGNGALTRRAVLAAARLREDPQLAVWIAAEGAFPASMVDRITPRATEATRQEVAERHGVADRCPVVTEPFRQWVIEDRFSAGRPPLDDVGVQFVGDVRPYALLKTRMLNAAHCALGHLGGLAGHETTAEAMDDPALRGYVRALLDEVEPLLPPVPGVDVAAYADTVLERLANPVIGDRLARLRRNGAAKMAAHVLTSLADAHAAGRPRAALTLAAAAWAQCLLDADGLAARLEIDDVVADRVRRARPSLEALLDDPSLGGALTAAPALAGELGAALEQLRRHGARSAARSYTAGASSAGSHAKPSGSVSGPAAPAPCRTMRCAPEPSGATPASLASARRP